MKRSRQPSPDLNSPDAAAHRGSRAGLRRFKPYPEYKDSGVEWLGRIPKHWFRLRLARVCLSRCDGPFGSSLKSEHYSPSGVRVIRLQNIGNARFKNVGETFIASEYAAGLGDHSVRTGDLLTAGLGDELNPVGRSCVAPANIEPAIVKADCFRFRLMENRISASFAAYQLSATAASAATALATGATRARINLTTAASRLLALPPLLEQRDIAAFLDRETAKLDALVAKKQRLIELLQEKRTALITRAVTKGLDPNVPMKDSGVEWLGEIPAHWEVRKIGQMFKKSKRQGYSEMPLLSVYREFGVIARSSRDDNFNRAPVDLDLYQLVGVGDLVINKMKAWQGSLGVSEIAGITSPDYIVYRPISRHLPRFIHYFLRNKMLSNVYLAISNGIRPNQWRLEPELFENLPVFVPPEREQSNIANFIDSEIQPLNHLIQTVETAIARLKERRSALISAAVTGKIDVRGEAA